MPSKRNAPTHSALSTAVHASIPHPWNPSNLAAIFLGIFQGYVQRTPQRTKLIDAFLGFLIVTGILQFAYCVVAGNYPFNAFLAGFSATVGQFVLAASLRIQSNPANKSEFTDVSPERAFADFIFCSVILHLFCTNFIN